MLHVKCYRKILKISWTEHRTNKSIRDELKLEDQWLENFIKKQKLKYFGHLKRSKGLGKIILDGKIERKRERGRPRRQWERNIRNAFDSSITEAGLWALDRSRFRCAVEDATSVSISS